MRGQAIGSSNLVGSVGMDSNVSAYETVCDPRTLVSTLSELSMKLESLECRVSDLSGMLFGPRVQTDCPKTAYPDNNISSLSGYHLAKASQTLEEVEYLLRRMINE